MKDKSNVARARWKLLAQVLKKQNQGVHEHSVRNFNGFDLFEKETMITDHRDASWVKYKLINQPDSKEIILRLDTNPLTAEDLIGFNNTGNVCIWPSEEVLAYHCWKHCKDMMNCENIIELGCGMTGLAGLFLAMNGDVKNMILTDGNQKSIENLGKIIDKNMPSNVSCRQLKWSTQFEGLTMESLRAIYDVILCADCLFFEELHVCLLSTLQFLCKPEGICILMAPRRSGSLDRFVEKAALTFDVEVREDYDDMISVKHRHHLEHTASYNPDLHYPVLVTLKVTKKDK